MSFADQYTPPVARRPHPVDVYVGSRLRLRRILLGMSQQKLSDALGVTFQQLQKYENGSNRVSASRLYQLSRLLGVPISFFFDDYAEGQPAQGSTPQGDAAPAAQIAEEMTHPEMSRRETLVLMRSYYRIKEPEVRQQLLDLLRSLGGTEKPA